MSFRNYEERKITCRETDETLEIIAQKSENCENIESYTLAYFLDYIIPERICDTIIDVRKISILELSHCNITSLPLECKNLNLKHLGLSHNKLTEVPLCLYSGLKYLESLDLSYNSIERFNIEPECLPYVKLIKLNNNNFENIPKWLLMFKCVNLEEFNYSHNKTKHFKYSRSSSNLDIIKLRKLEMKNNQLDDDAYKFLKCFKFLEYLDISNEGYKIYNRLTGLDDLFVKPRWERLSVLRANSLSLSIFPEGITWIYTLKELYITDNHLSWLSDSIEYLVNLEILDISNNDIIAIPRSILPLEKLTRLQASNNYIAFVPDISQMPSLKFVDLYNNYLDEVTFSISSFDSVDLEYNYYNTEDLEHYPVYQEKKSSLRKNLENDMRWHGPKERPKTPERSENDESDKEELETIHTWKTINYPATTHEEENWDDPVNIRDKNSEVDSVDDNWYGEENERSSKVFESRDKLYVSDDDWMFIDCEES